MEIQKGKTEEVDRQGSFVVRECEIKSINKRIK
jgi:hypothetical protein